MHLKVLTYNIHKGFGSGNRRFVLHKIRELLTETDPDIVFLQEIHGEAGRRRNKMDAVPDTPHFEYLADRLWPHYAYGKNAIYRKGDHGNAILSKYPFEFWENLNVSRSRFASRSILHGVVQVPGKDIKLHTLCVHLGLFEAEREEQMAVLTDRIESHIPHQEPMIIAGDFNDWRGRASERFESELEVQEIFATLTGRHARTFPIWFPLLRVDRIYYRGLEPRQCYCFAKGPWRRLSDHAALCGIYDF